MVTERGRPVASLIPFREDGMGTAFGERHLLPEFEALPETAGDSTLTVSEDRDRQGARAVERREASAHPSA